MGEAAHVHGEMDIADQRGTFDGFLVATVWGSTLIAQTVALLVLAFAMGLGWWAGWAAFLVIGAVSGALFKMQSAWWATLIALLVVLGIGGVIVPLLAGLMG